MNIEYLAGVLVGVVFGLVLVALIFRLTKTDKSSKCKYDERQELVRGKGYRYAFGAMVIYNGLMTVLKLADVPVFMQDEIMLFISLLLGVVVYAAYCIWNDAYFALNENRKRVLIAFGLIAAINLFVGVKNGIDGILIVDGELTYASLNLLCGILFLIIFVVLGIKGIAQKAMNE